MLPPPISLTLGGTASQQGGTLRFKNSDVTVCLVGPGGFSTVCLCFRTNPSLHADHQPSTWASGQCCQGVESETVAEGQYRNSDLLLSATLAGVLARFFWGVPSTPHPAWGPPSPLSVCSRLFFPWSQERLPLLPACQTHLAPLGSAGCRPTQFLRLSFCRYCTEDSPSFPRPSLLESHISLMHGIRNPDLSQTSKVRPPGGHSPQVSVGSLPTAAASLVRPGAGEALGRPRGAHLSLWLCRNSSDSFPRWGSLSSSV